MKLKILSKKEVKHIHEMINKQWGCAIDLDYVFMQNRDNKLYVANREVFEIDESRLRIDSIGMYFGKVEHGQLRLSIEGSQIIGPKAVKNTVSVPESWYMGEDVETESPKGWLIAKVGKDYAGCGHSDGKTIKNYMTKTRKVSALS